MTESDEKTMQEAVKKADLVEIAKSANIETEKKFIEETGEPTKIVYYCNDCEKLIKPKRIGKKLKFSCTECKGDNVAFGSEESIANYYKIKTPEKQE